MQLRLLSAQVDREDADITDSDSGGCPGLCLSYVHHSQRKKTLLEIQFFERLNLRDPKVSLPSRRRQGGEGEAVTGTCMLIPVEEIQVQN